MPPAPHVQPCMVMGMGMDTCVCPSICQAVPQCWVPGSKVG